MTGGWQEPTRSLPLRWGTYAGRYGCGLALIISGLVGLQGANANFLPPLALGTMAHVLGWWLMPAAGWRRIWVVLPSLIVVFVLLIGPAGVGLLAVCFACWLLVRHRPAITFLLALPVLGVGILLRQVYSEYDGMLPALAIMAAVIIACAWLARLIHRQRSLKAR